MRLHELFPDVAADLGMVEITGLAYDEHGLSPGALFFCLRGARRDGHDFAAQAVSAGAAALVVSRPVAVDAPQVLVADVRKAVGPAAAAFYGHPTSELTVVGVTGTNGKTTNSYLVRALLEADGRQTGLLSTITNVIGGVQTPVEPATVHPAIELQRTFRRMLDGGDRACAMEVFSQWLAVAQVDSLKFEVAIFTNLTRDHLDFHLTMENYFGAKRRLFTEWQTAHAVINVDDPYGVRLAGDPEVKGEVVTFALDDETAAFRATDLRTESAGSRFTILAPDGVYPVVSPLRGRFNVYNVLGAFAAARTLGVSASTATAAIASAGQVPGRFESVDEGQSFVVLVDYAHSPDSLENVLSAARELTDRRLHLVFGCGGDRDHGKRPLMGEIATRMADDAIVTSDNPRSEDPEAIIAEILSGTDGSVTRIVDRRDAIDTVIERAKPGDVVVIAGKGHEQGQEFTDGRKVPFDDVAVAREALRRLAARTRPVSRGRAGDRRAPE
jgi:UDP-N-acetylmuramoyl-L-alanyl-D-glutamate--2,6-diaminopimelate ligase